ncbi:MAG: hypothetical protein GWM98_02455 [Nitrospinaceae bacterium]|nr:hypothetical protein [Nitrospinaceae bacterium]NIR53567.1 hypothetical protein [Nitrospinaceae bacterium]NIS83968.1 hypothetical protein [Nitrospinaceae bacterium]NIT80777.1 hypothetical protein [Nitrospinaceae bacterium]NIU43083.1 hypothetical protein [Nitrospinaceae bacterium]
MFNKLGIEVQDSPRAVREELLQGSGAVMADGVSIFVEAGNVKDRQIVVCRSPGPGESTESKIFDVEQYDEAWKQLQAWRLS